MWNYQMSSKTFIISAGSDCVIKIPTTVWSKHSRKKKKTVDKEPFIQEIQDLPNTSKDSEFIHGAI